MIVSDVVLLAIARYPNEPVLLAVDHFYSDRRAAGLGALKDDPELDERPGALCRRKYMANFGRAVTYVFHRGAFQHFDRQELPPYPGRDMDKLTVTVRREPAYHYLVGFKISEFHSQRGRRDVAIRLRAIRTQIQRLHPRPD